jgi:hypothetical protein
MQGIVYLRKAPSVGSYPLAVNPRPGGLRRPVLAIGTP